MKKCSRCKKEKSLDNFNKEKTTKDGLSTYCKNCRKNIRHKSYIKNKSSIISKQLEKRRASQDWVRQFKTKCNQCGEAHPAVLDFHHLQNKEHSIGSLTNRNNLTNKIKKLIKLEIKKCIVLCSNCHRKLHWEQNRIAHTGNAPVSQP
jgi:endonuclease I